MQQDQYSRDSDDAKTVRSVRMFLLAGSFALLPAALVAYTADGGRAWPGLTWMVTTIALSAALIRSRRKLPH